MCILKLNFFKNKQKNCNAFKLVSWSHVDIKPRLDWLMKIWKRPHSKATPAQPPLVLCPLSFSTPMAEANVEVGPPRTPDGSKMHAPRVRSVLFSLLGRRRGGGGASSGCWRKVISFPSNADGSFRFALFFSQHFFLFFNISVTKLYS